MTDLFDNPDELITVLGHVAKLVADTEFTMKEERAIRNLVGAGRADSLPLKMTRNRGSTKVNKKIVTKMASVPMMPG